MTQDEGWISGTGFLYVASNDAMPTMVKVGIGDRHPALRVAELSDSTAVPLPFTLEFFVEVADTAAAERLVHDHIGSSRVHRNREFFRLTTDEAIRVIVEVAGELIPENAAMYALRGELPTVGATRLCGRCGKRVQMRAVDAKGTYCSCGSWVER